MLRDSGRMTDGSVFYFVSDCQLVVDSWKREGSVVAELNIGPQTSGDKSVQC